ncbi:MAG: hypothetical protein LBK29_02155 [Oscillospiraceae bacterium]|jgi:hypothetical protein|nr:hypothetical protein [Oscillospiraceae bacterium]
MASPNMSVANGFVQLVSAIKSLKKEFSFFSLEKKHPIKRLFNLLISSYRTAKKTGTIEDMQHFVQYAREETNKCIDDFNRKIKSSPYSHGISEKKINLLQNLSAKLSLFEESLDQAKITEDKVNELQQNIINSPDYDEVKGIKGTEVYRIHLKHPMGGSGILSQINMDYELIVVLTGTFFDSNKNVRTRKDCRTIKAADVSIKKNILSLATMDIKVCVYVTFIDGIMAAGGEIANIVSNLPQGLLN